MKLEPVIIIIIVVATPCLEKDDTDLARYKFDIRQLVLILYLAECYHVVIYFHTLSH